MNQRWLVNARMKYNEYATGIHILPDVLSGIMTCCWDVCRWMTRLLPLFSIVFCPLTPHLTSFSDERRTN